ncbi:MAG: hypothetical protein M0P11_07835 [Anaerolineaceae bacterium]|nr:hypothetical protein [Anaerolineaceae bacterium]
MKKTTTFLLLVAVLIFSLTSCLNTRPDASRNPETVQPDADKTLPTRTLPAPAEGRGVVCGYLMDDETNLPPEAALFLSENIAFGREDVPAMMSFSFQTNPRAEMAEDGYYCFENVEPGVYALTLWTPPDNVEFLEAEDGQDYLWIEVEPGSVVDLGHLSQ